ncbi:hypothetical protein ACFFMN_23945 [Planobispora siamensis]|nr:hypothetical protein [Planobispora siamensis]
MRKHRENVADSGYTAIQAGSIHGSDTAEQASAAPREGAAPDTDAVDTVIVNMQADRAKVGMQAGVVVGDVHIQM